MKAKCTELKRDNKRERQEYKQGQGYLFDPPFKLGNLTAEFAKIDDASDETSAGVQEKERRYAELVKGQAYQFGRLLADTWCAAFVWKKDGSELGNLCPTERIFRKVESHATAGLLPHVRAEVERLRNQYQFFHWHLAFPDVFRLTNKEAPDNEPAGWSGGFDIVLGNPPWEKVNLNAREWFAQTRPDIAGADTSAIRTQLIDELRAKDRQLFERYKDAQRVANGIGQFLKVSGRFPLSSRGDTNTYAVFADLDSQLLSVNGLGGFIVPSGIAFDETTKFFFQHLVENGLLLRLFDFDNSQGIFPEVHRSYRFSLATIYGTPRPTSATIEMQFFNPCAHRSIFQRASITQRTHPTSPGRFGFP